MKKLDEAQIEALYAFTRQHFVECYDVQTELVDHLANGIEEQWLENPTTTFDHALKNEFKKFGVFGFMEIVEQKTRALEIQYRKQVWNCLKEYFKLPKIILTSFSIWALFTTLNLFENKGHIAMCLIFGVLCFYFFFILKETKRIKKTQKQTGKKWLFENVILQFGGLLQLLNLGIYMPIINFDREWDTLALWSFSICLVLYVLWFYISVKVVSPKMKHKFSKEYPKYFLTFKA